MLEPNNDSERRALKELKNMTKDLNQDEPTLIRFLKARSYNPDKANKMLRDCLVWRDENRIDEILKWDAPEYLQTDFPYHLTCPDNDGGPIMWIPFGSWDKSGQIRTFIDQGGREEILRWAYYFIENGLNKIKTNRNGRYQANVVFDLEGLTYTTCSHMETVRILFAGFKVFDSCYPEICKRIIIINAPWIFKFPLQVIKQALHQNTCNKFHIFTSNKQEWMTYFLEIFPRSSILDSYFKDENGN